jgi:hypothetical protein
MKHFANHWGTEFLLKECFGNLYTYHRKQANKPVRSKGTCLTKQGQRPGGSGSSTTAWSSSTKCSHKLKSKMSNYDDSNHFEYQLKVQGHKAALHRSVDHKAANLKWKLDVRDNNDCDNHKDAKQKANNT